MLGLRVRVIAVVSLLSCLGTALAAPVSVRGFLNLRDTGGWTLEETRVAFPRTFALRFGAVARGSLTVGSEVTIRGDWDAATDVLQVAHMHAHARAMDVRNTALLETASHLLRERGGWRGRLHVDGQDLEITPETRTNLEGKLIGERLWLTPDVLISYEGQRLADGTVLAASLRVQPHRRAPQERAVRFRPAPRVVSFTSAGKPAADLQLDEVGTYRLVQDPEAQDYVTRLGQRLIPDAQRTLPDGDPAKLGFRFFLVADEEPNAFALGDGTVVVNDGLLRLLENEAQLAAIIGHEIAHATQEHLLLQRRARQRWGRLFRPAAAVARRTAGHWAEGLVLTLQGGFVNRYSRTLERQADRLGLEYLVAAGYDPREAARVWQVKAEKFGDRRTNVLTSHHDNYTTRRRILMSEIATNYASLDFARCQRDSEKRREIAARLGR